MRLIRGGPGTGKTALVFREFKQALRDGVPTRLIVPTATLVRHFQHELARDGEVFPPAAVVSLARFTAQAAEPLKPLPADLLHAFVRDALRRSPSSEFAAAAETEGMAATVIETIALFENAGATPDQLVSRKLKAHPKAFARIWAAVSSRVRECGFATRLEILRAAAANTTGQSLWFDGFVTFSPVEIELIQALSKTCRVTVTLTDGPSTDDVRRQAMQWVREDKLLNAPPRRPEIAAVHAVSPEREADEIARRIVELRERGVAFRDIGVGLRDAETYLALLRATFERFGIPARFYFSSPLRHHPAARFLGGLIRNVLEGWEFGAAIDALRAHPQWGSGAAFDRFDFAIREAMPGRGAEALLALCEEDRLRPEIAECFAVASWAQEKLLPEQWARRLCHLAESLYRPGRIEPPRDFADVETLRSQAAGVRAWSDAISGTPAFWPESSAPTGLEAFWRVAEEFIDAGSVRVRDDRRDAVHVMHVYEVRQWDVAALFVCGMTDRDFPRRAPQNLLFPDADIEALRRSGIPLRRGSDLDRDEDALFASLRGRARSSLILTFPEHDSGGRSVESSRYIERLRDEGRADLREARSCRPEAAHVAGPGGLPGRIVSAEMLPALAARHKSISLTTLEDLAQCRFKFFAGRTLALRARPERPRSDYRRESPA